MTLYALVHGKLLNMLLQHELKHLCRGGIPAQNRKDVWRRLIEGQVKDIREEKGPHYYNHLVNLAHDSQVMIQKLSSTIIIVNVVHRL